MYFPGSAPNTPIASAKRARIAKRDVKSPIKSSLSMPSSPVTVQPPASTGTHLTNNAEDLRHKNTAPGGRTSSKALFSPVPRIDGDTTQPPSTESSPEAVESFEGASVDVGSHPDEDAANTSSIANESDENEEDIFNPYQFIAGLPSHESVTRGKVFLPPLSTETVRKPTLALDLDETLVHCTVEPIDKPDIVFPVTFNGTLYNVYVRKRPYLDYFLETVSRSFEVVVFTASQKVYADVLLNLLDPENKYICHRLFREACLLVQGNYLKDLHVLGRDLQKTVLVDNSPHAYGFQIDNGIPIESWFDDDTDTELLKLVGFLRRVVTADDVRPIVREHFKTFELVDIAAKGGPIQLSAPPF